MTKPRHFIRRVVPPLLVEIAVWAPVGELVSAVLKLFLGTDFEMSQFFLANISMIRGVGVGLIIAFTIDDLASKDSWILATWKSFFGHKANVIFEFDNNDHNVFRYVLNIKIGRDSKNVFFAARSAKLIHYIDGTSKWEWIAPQVILWEKNQAKKGEDQVFQLFSRNHKQPSIITCIGRQVEIDNFILSNFLIEIFININGQTEKVRRVFEVHPPSAVVTRMLEPDWMSYTPEEPS